MWGNAEEAATLSADHPLTSSILRTTSALHTPLSSPQWQELLHQYELLVHIEKDTDEIIYTACANTVAHAPSSSNLAALTLHTSRMLQDLHSTLNNTDKKKSEVSSKIVLVGKARATCGALNWLRILSHALISAASTKDEDYIVEAFTYTPRSTSTTTTAPPTPSSTSSNRTNKSTKSSKKYKPKQRNAALELIHALLSFLSTIGANNTFSKHLEIAEIYDASILSMSLLLVLLSTQLYSPMKSSYQCQKEETKVDEKHQHQNHFLNLIMKESFLRRNQHLKFRNDDASTSLHASAIQGFTSSSSTSPITPPENYATSILSSTLTLLLSRPKPPSRSLIAYKSTLTTSIIHEIAKTKHFVLSKDGMYECHDIVLSTKPQLMEKDHRRGLLKKTPSQHIVTPSTESTSSPTTTQSSSLDVLGGDGQPLAPPSSTSLSTTSNLIITSSFMKSATQNVLHLSSTILFLPIRLMFLALNIWSRGSSFSSRQHRSFSLATNSDDTKSNSYEQMKITKLQSSSKDNKQYTNDVLYITDSPLADLGCALFLLLTNNCRYSFFEGEEEIQNPFRQELERLNDNRWEGRVTAPISTSGTAPFLLEEESTSTTPACQKLLSINFEYLFESFGKTLHTELSSLVLYTLLQSSPIFAASVAVRSDLDTLVLPLLRTLYFSSAVLPPSQQQQQQLSKHHHHPFRTSSQIYLLLILLLLFTQDPSFGPDSFRRIILPSIPWYKERSLKSISLGSILILSCLRSLSYNLNRGEGDAFWLSNVCAVLLNISPHVEGLHEYACMRLVSVSVGCMKRFRSLIVRERGVGGGVGGEYIVPEEGDLSSLVGMYGETCRTLLQLLKHAVRPKVVETNIHLVYALAYYQTDFYNAIAAFDDFMLEDDDGFVGVGSSNGGGLDGVQASPFQPTEIGILPLIISKADSIIRKDHQTRTATEAMEILKQSVHELKNIRVSSQTTMSLSSSGVVMVEPLDSTSAATRDRSNSIDSLSSTCGSEAGDFAFTYEEEVDPEVFFIPYVWDVIVCVATSSCLAGVAEWEKDQICVFSLLEGGDKEEDDELVENAKEEGYNVENNGNEGASTSSTSGTYGANGLDVV